MSQLWLLGFELVNNHHCSHRSNFPFFLKMCKNCTHCKISDNLLLDSGMCLKPHQRVTPCTKEKEFWFYLHLLWSYSSNKVKRVNFVVIHSVAPVDTMQKCDGFWLPGAKRFQTVYYINGFAAIIFSRYYTINSHYNSVKNRVHFAYIVLSIKQDTAHKRYNAAHGDKKDTQERQIDSEVCLDQYIGQYVGLRCSIEGANEQWP